MSAFHQPAKQQDWTIWFLLWISALMAAHYFLALCFDSTPWYNCCLKQIIWQKQNIHKPAFSQSIWLSGCRHSLGVGDQMHLGEAWTWTELEVSFFLVHIKQKQGGSGISPCRGGFWPRSSPTIAALLVTQVYVWFCELSLVYFFSCPNDSWAVNQSEFHSGCTNENRYCYL